MEDYSRLKKELIAVSNFAIGSFHSIQQRIYPQQFASTYSYVISYLCDNDDRDIFQRDIEREFGLSRSTVSNVLKELEREGLVERKAVTTDARLRKVVATQGARMINAACDKEISNMLVELFDGIADDELESLTATLARIRENSERIK